ncbi:hypothetical protein [Capillibacterium thermochitinicola]|uniref:Uncharacterized protein n=1 Tax=Capillibacterium thermochitinicola TaxID=2699427 RepID=A0A8J6HY38_9FIRM|nr:hypothetical protein [Capillibacterium thermochitinicola]MBA2131966.1 hypothetical protein [Capillibacterium thermochitinicola]
MIYEQAMTKNCHMDECELNTKAFSNIISLFNEYDHKPSREMLKALKEIIETLTAMAFGKADNKYFLSSIDPGVGKSTAIIQWLRVFLESTDSALEGVGVLIGLERYEEIQRFVDECKLVPDQYAVFVKEDHPLNDLGCGKYGANKAKVLFTTKAQIRIKSAGKHFKDVKQFYYKDKSRQVRIWDESLLVGKALTINRTAIGSLLETVEKWERSTGEKKVLDILEKLLVDLKKYKDGEVFQFPDLRVSLNEALRIFENSTPDRKDYAETLWLMSGKAVTVRNQDGFTLVDCTEDLPEDFAPCLITDASGRVRETYRLQEAERKNLVRLKTANKDYSNLTIHVWRRPRGKFSFNNRDSFDEIAEEVAKVINSKPEEEFLVIGFKPVDRYGRDNIEVAIKKRMTTNPERVKFTHWGKHTATNQFANIPNVILAGTLFYRTADYEAIGRAAAGRTTTKGIFSSNEITRVKHGESCHHILQASCRGAIRKCIGDSCPKSDLWLIASPITGVEALLPVIFPGSRIILWMKDKNTLKGKAKEAFEYIMGRFREDEDLEKITEVEVRKALGFRDNYMFRRDVLNKKEFIEMITEKGIVVKEGGRRRNEFVKVNFKYSPN